MDDNLNSATKVDDNAARSKRHVAMPENTDRIQKIGKKSKTADVLTSHPSGKSKSAIWERVRNEKHENGSLLTTSQALSHFR